MHVLIVPTDFTGSLTAVQAAAAMAQGWSQAAPHDVLATVPISDGGPGFVDVVAAAAGGRLHACVTTDPLGRSVPATILLAEVAGRSTAYVESAQAVGLHLLAVDERDPTQTTSFGMGALLAAAVDLGATRIVVGLGGSGTNDAGAGLLTALGVGTRARLGAGGLALLDAREDDLDRLEAARRLFTGIDLVAATDSEAPLLGLKGTSAMSAVGKGASQEQAQRLENAIGHFASIVSRVRPPATDLLSGALLRPERDPGAGAAGGLGYALRLLGARRVGGVRAVLDAAQFDTLLRAADLVVTGEASFDWESLHGPVMQVAVAA
ncbi:MAG: glycerate kinase, partial [Terracoccus sp.]